MVETSFAAQQLARRFGADPGSADWKHFGRMPGFTNYKMKHQQADGQFPFALLRSACGREFPAAEKFQRDLSQDFARLQ